MAFIQEGKKNSLETTHYGEILDVLVECNLKWRRFTTHLVNELDK